MLKLIQDTYGFSNYQIAQLRYFFLTIASELSKLILIGLFFTDNISLYIWAILIFHVVRSNTGGIHCKTYWGCFLVSLTYMLLSIRILPLLEVSKFVQMLTLLFCIVITYNIGPITSIFHLALSDTTIRKLKIKLFYIIFIYLLIAYIIPQNLYIDIGYWVIILNTLQLAAAKLLRKETI